MRWLTAAGIALALGGRVTSATAQSDADIQRAREEFREALALQTAGDCATALEKLRNVGRIKMTPHVQFNIALCEERLGRLVSALGHYQLALADADAAGIEDVATPAQGAIDSLEGRIPRLTIVRGEHTDGAAILLDGELVGDNLLGQPQPRDPGSHSVEARVGESVVFQQAVSLAEGAQEQVVVTFERAPVTVLPGEAKAAPAPRRTVAAEAEAEPSTARRTIGYVAGGTGILSLALAGVFIGLRQVAIGDLEDQCDGNACPPEAQPNIDDGRLYTGLAEGGVLLGVAGLVTGAVLLFGGGSDDEAGPVTALAVGTDPSRHSGSVRLSGSF